MKKILTITFLLIILGCDNERSQIIRLIGKHIAIDESYQSISIENNKSLNTAFHEFDKPIKIVTYMDSSACTQCSMQILIEWNSMLKEVLSDSIGFIVVIAPSDKTNIKLSLNILNLQNPLLYDTNDCFLKKINYLIFWQEIELFYLTNKTILF